MVRVDNSSNQDKSQTTIMIQSANVSFNILTHLTVDEVCSVSADIKLWSGEEATETMIVELTPDSLQDQVEEENNDEVEDDETIHLLTNLSLIAELFIIGPPVEPDEGEDSQDEDAGQDQSDVESHSGIIVTNLENIVKGAEPRNRLLLKYLQEVQDPRDEHNNEGEDDGDNVDCLIQTKKFIDPVASSSNHTNNSNKKHQAIN